jgi:hypothetical protein
MPKRSSIHRAPQDESQLAKSIVDELTIDEDEPETKPEKNPAAVALGRLGGLKGGKARATKLSNLRKSEIAHKAAETRWQKYYDEQKKKSDE